MNQSTSVFFIANLVFTGMLRHLSFMSSPDQAMFSVEESTRSLTRKETPPRTQAFSKRPA